MPVYCFIDEIFKGTNTTERIAIRICIIIFESSTRVQNCSATHDIELSELLKDNYQNFHFNETIENDEIHFDYKIKKVKRIREMQLNCCELLTSLTKSTNEPRIRLKI